MDQPIYCRQRAVKDLNHYYGEGTLRRQILFGIDLEVHAGEFVIMTGPSGSGQSTLLSLVGCLRSLQEGSLKALGQALRGQRSDRGRAIARMIYGRLNERLKRGVD